MQEPQASSEHFFRTECKYYTPPHYVQKSLKNIAINVVCLKQPELIMDLTNMGLLHAEKFSKCLKDTQSPLLPADSLPLLVTVTHLLPSPTFTQSQKKNFHTDHSTLWNVHYGFWNIDCGIADFVSSIMIV